MLMVRYSEYIKKANNTTIGDQQPNRKTKQIKRYELAAYKRGNLQESQHAQSY